MRFPFRKRQRIGNDPVREGNSLAKLTYVFGLVAVALLIFGTLLILTTTVVWPAENAERHLQTISLSPDGCLLVEYPAVLDATDMQEPLKIFVSAAGPTTVTLAVPFAIGVEQISPPERLARQQLYTNALAVDLLFGTSDSAAVVHDSQNLSAGVPVAVASSLGCSAWQITATSSLVAKRVETSTLSLLNRNSEHVESRQTPFGVMLQSGVISTSVDGVAIYPVTIALETAFRRHIEGFVAATGENSMLFALAAMTASLGGWLFSRWQNNLHQKEIDRSANEQNTNRLISQFVSQVATCNKRDAVDTANIIRQSYRGYVSDADLQRMEQLLHILGGLPPDELSVEDFAFWPDAWAGAFILASKDPRIRKSPALRRYVRMFPREHLRSDTAHRFEAAFDAIQLVPSQARNWPIRLSDPPNEDYHLSHKLLENFGGVDLFPNDRADIPSEQHLLFSKKPGYYWQEHPVATQVEQSRVPVIVTGTSGCGKTALGLAYGRYHHARDTFATYVAGYVDLSTIQRSLASTLLVFIRQHPTWLVHFDNSMRDLCASVLASVLDRRYLLASLGATSLVNYDKRVGSSAVDPDDLANRAWRAHALTEFRLLHNAVETVIPANSGDFGHWLGSLVYCIDALRFVDRRIAIDMHVASAPLGFEALAKVADAMGVSEEQRFRVLVLTSSTTAEMGFARTYGFISLDMSWEKHENRDPLNEMLEYRCKRVGANIDVFRRVFGDPERWFEKCNRNPGKVARLWTQALAQFGEMKEQIGQAELDALVQKL